MYAVIEIKNGHIHYLKWYETLKEAKAALPALEQLAARDEKFHGIKKGSFSIEEHND